MKKSNNYLLLSALFFFGFLVVKYTDTFGNSSWFKLFLIILCITFLISGISQKKKKK